MNQIDVAIKHYEAALKAAFPKGADGEVFLRWKYARQAIEQAGKVEPVGYMDSIGEFHQCRLDDRDVPIYLHPPTAPAEIDFLQHDDHLRFIQRVLESDSPKSDRDEAAQMVRDIRRSIRPTAQQPLTDEQIEAIAAALGFNESGPHFAFARAIEAHIKGEPK